MAPSERKSFTKVVGIFVEMPVLCVWWSQIGQNSRLKLVTTMPTINELLQRLQGDNLRKSRRFSDDIREANELLHNRAAFDDERWDCMRNWCQANQPCQFGIRAAQENRIHFSFLTHEAVSQWSDGEIAEKISEDKKLWKQRAAFDPDRAAHSFMLVVASQSVALAAPDANLEAFSNHLLELAGWSVGAHRSARRVNEVSSDFLYLRNPQDSRLYGFQFNVDFFACAAHDRWWHDHRVPGGIAFTANSLGHMRAFREWYLKKAGDASEWAVKLAMVTIENAEPGKVPSKPNSAAPAGGRVTWLRALRDGKPFISDIPSPLKQTPSSLQNKDWTKYEGFLHTDHAVRSEFFQDRDVPPTFEQPYRMDFMYIYAKSQGEFVEFTQGKPFADDKVFAEIGRPEDWSHRATPPKRMRSDSDSLLVAEQMAACQRWLVNPLHAPLDD